MELGNRRYNLDILERVIVLPSNKETIAFLKEENDCYVDLQNTANFGESNIRLHHKNKVCVVEKFKQTIYKHGLEVMLLDADGILNETINSKKIFSILDMVNEIENASVENIEKFDKISKEVARGCANELGIYGEKRDTFEYLLSRYVYTDLLTTRNAIWISKIDHSIDYKVSRVLKLLKMELNLSNIKNFQIQYNRNKVLINDNLVLDCNKEMADSNSRVYIRK